MITIPYHLLATLITKWLPYHILYCQLWSQNDSRTISSTVNRDHKIIAVPYHLLSPLIKKWLPYYIFYCQLPSQNDYRTISSKYCQLPSQNDYRTIASSINSNYSMITMPHCLLHIIINKIINIPYCLPYRIIINDNHTISATLQNNYKIIILTWRPSLTM